MISNLSINVWELKSADPALADVRTQFIDLYKEIFAEEPYCEVYEDKQVAQKFDLFMQGLFFVASDGRKLVGFSCALPFGCDDNEVNRHPFMSYVVDQGRNPASYWCIREWAVAQKYRGMKTNDSTIASQLLERLLTALGDQPIMLETANAHNDRIIQIYRQRGFAVVDGLRHHMVEKRKSDGIICERPLSLLFMVKQSGVSL